MAQYLPVVALLILCIIFGAVSILVSRLLNKPQPNSAKNAPYECGILDVTEPPERFPVRFYLIAMIFIVFDIEIVFLYPFALVFRGLGPFGLIAIAVFAVAVFESFLYLIANGALDWGSVKRVRHSGMVDPTRSLGNTVRKVGLEGRGDESILSGVVLDEAAPSTDEAA
ncbi:MAG: NADH-quinone oxidoreductase subunit A [Microthrixaceae bacterium]|nr:NADH-quinone oxidoreductase subunit A [Microthrixaceae bacterium]